VLDLKGSPFNRSSKETPMNTASVSPSPASHSFLGKLPPTDCEGCLQVRMAVGKTMIAAETVLSKFFGFAVGQEIDTSIISKEIPVCVEMPTLTAEDVISFRGKLKMTQKEFAEAYGISVATVKEWESIPIAA
jgi:hypothetical protein